MTDAIVEEPHLVSYRQVWTHRNRDGDYEYSYYCVWSDGEEGMAGSLRWDRIGDAVALPTVDLKSLKKEES